MNSKLYRVTLRGFGGFNTSVDFKVSYVVAENSHAAYAVVRQHLDGRDYGFHKDRELLSVELVAEANDCAECQTRLFP